MTFPSFHLYKKLVDMYHLESMRQSIYEYKTLPNGNCQRKLYIVVKVAHVYRSGVFFRNSQSRSVGNF